MRRGTEIIGLPVITFDQGARIDRVIDLLFDPDGNQIRGLIVDEGGVFSAPRIVPFENIKSLGPDGVIVADKHAVVDAGKIPAIRDLLKRQVVLKGTKLMTTDGRFLGTLRDLYFNPENGRVEGYELSGGLFADAYTGRSFVPAPSTIKIGQHVAFVPPEVAEQMAAQVGGIRGAFAGAGDQLQSAAQDAGSQFQAAAQNAGSQFQTAAQDANSRLQPALASANARLQASQDAASAQFRTARESVSQNLPGATSRVNESLQNSHEFARNQFQQSTSALNEGARRALASQALDEAMGRTAQQAVASDNGVLIVDEGDKVTPDVILLARQYRREQELLSAVGLNVTSVAQARTNDHMALTRRELGTAAEQARVGFSDLYTRSRSRLAEWQQQTEKSRLEGRIHDALGRPIERVLLDKQDRVILNTGELITNQAVERARQAGVLDILLNSVSPARPVITQEQLRAPEQGAAALESDQRVMTLELPS